MINLDFTFVQGVTPIKEKLVHMPQHHAVRA